MVFAVHVVRVVGRDQRGADRAGDLDQLRVRVALGLQTVVLQLDEEVVLPEDLLQSCRLVEGPLVVALEQRLQDVTAEAAGGRDEALVVPAEQLPVHPRLVVVALHEGQAGQLDQVAIALITLGEQREVVVQLLAALGVAAGVVDAATTRRALTAVLVGHVGLGADDRLDALGTTLLEELEHPVHVAVIGDTERRLAVGDGLGDEIIEARCAVQHRELRVDVEVGE